MKLSSPRKLLGEQAECVFLAQAALRGFFVSKPYGDSAPYDFIVQPRPYSLRPPTASRRPSTLLRIQVKSVGSKDSQGRYTANTRRSLSRSYLPGEIDFFACWIVPLDLWYIIPAALVGLNKCVHLYPDVQHSRGRYKRFREAWDLLL